MAIGAEFTGFNYMKESVVADIKKNIYCLFGTPEGTIPGDRSFGLSTDYVDNPLPVAENLLALDIYEKVETYEPRVAVKDIVCEADIDGHLSARVLLEPNDDYEPDDDEDEGEE